MTSFRPLKEPEIWNALLTSVQLIPTRPLPQRSHAISIETRLKQVENLLDCVTSETKIQTDKTGTKPLCVKCSRKYRHEDWSHPRPTAEKWWISNKDFLYSNCQAIARIDSEPQTKSVTGDRRLRKQLKPQMLQVQTKWVELVTGTLRKSDINIPLVQKIKSSRESRRVKYLEDLLNMETMKRFRSVATLSYARIEMRSRDKTLSR